MQYRSADTKMAALKEAVRAGRHDIAMDMLSDHPTVRAYVRSPASPLGIQLHTRKPFPAGTKTIVIVDYGPGGNEKLYYVVPVTAVKRVIARDRKTARPRPVNPDSDHCYMAPEVHFPQYLNGWGMVPPLEIEGFQPEEHEEPGWNPIEMDAFPHPASYYKAQQS